MPINIKFINSLFCPDFIYVLFTGLYTKIIFLHSINWPFFIPQNKWIYWEVRNESLYIIAFSFLLYSVTYLATSVILPVSKFTVWHSLLWLGGLAKLRKATISFHMIICLPACRPDRPSVYPSAWDNSDPTGPIFTKLNIWVFSTISLHKSKLLHLTRITILCLHIYVYLW